MSFAFVFINDHSCIAQAPQNKTSIQKTIFSLEGKISLDSLTKYVHNRSGIRFSFNSAKVKSSTEIGFPSGQYSFQALLDQVRKTTSLYYTLYKGYVIFEDKPSKRKQTSTSGANTSFVKKKVPPLKKRVTEKPILSNSARNKKRTDNSSKVIMKDTAQKLPTTALTHIAINPDQDSVIYLKKVLITRNKAPIDSIAFAPANNNSSGIRTIKIDSLNNAEKIFIPGRQKDIPSLHTSQLVRSANKTNTGIHPHIHFGPVWYITLPLQGTHHYFTGTNGKPEPYNLLIPALWINNVFKGNHEIMIQLAPARQYFAGNNTLVSVTGPGSSADTTLVKRNTDLIKTGGMEAGLQYSYYLTPNLCVGAGISYYWQRKVLINRQTSRLSDGRVLSDSLYSVRKTSADGLYFNSSIWLGKMEMRYMFKKLHAGITVFIPITSLTALPRKNIRPVNGQLFLRWVIK